MTAEELAAVGDALGLLANILMAWYTAQMQVAFDRLNARRSTAGLIGRIAPTRAEGINLRGVFRFPVEVYADRLLPGDTRLASSSFASICRMSSISCLRSRKRRSSSSTW